MRNLDKVVPPGNHVRYCGMHWLKINRFGSASVGEELIALQWNPGSQTWTHSNAHDMNRAIDTSGWEYVVHIPYPALPEREPT